MKLIRPASRMQPYSYQQIKTPVQLYLLFTLFEYALLERYKTFVSIQSFYRVAEYSITDKPFTSDSSNIFCRLLSSFVFHCILS